MEERERDRSSRSAQRYMAMFKARNKRISFMAMGACALLMVVALVIVGISFLSKEAEDDGLILDNVYIAGVNLGGMDRSEAESALRLTIGDSFSTQNMVVTLPDDQLVLTPVVSQAFVDIEELVDAAYDYGRSGTKLENKIARERSKDRDHIIALLDYMYLDLESIRREVDDFCESYSSVLVQTSVALSGNRPNYWDVIADGIPITSVRHQTLVINMGTPQFYLDADVLYNKILDAYSMFRMEFTYDAPISQVPDTPDAQALFDTYCILPEDAVMDSSTFLVTPEIYGYGFDVAEVARRIHRAEYGETITITLGFLYPEITEEDLNLNYFQNVLATFISSGNAGDSNRNTNLQLACDVINGTILKTGESFDFNMILGPRTTNAGYKSAPTYTGSSTNTIGGGISQVASALRYCAMLAGLQIDEYHLHTYAVPYTPYGTDAAINYGAENLVFTNNTPDPIQIFTSFIDGNVFVSITGTEERDYTVGIEHEVLKVLEPETTYQYMTEDNVYGYKDGHQLQAGLTGYIVAIYVCRYDSVTGELLSRELQETCTYSRRDQILVKLEQDDEAFDPTYNG